MPASTAHIAGIGVSHAVSSIDEPTAIAAGVKALLDAGLTYNDVDHSVASFLNQRLRIPPTCFDTFGMKGAAVSVVDNNSGLFTAIQYIRSGQANCVLVLGIDTESAAASSHAAVVGIMLVSDLVLNSHAYLRDSAVSIAACCMTNRIHSRRAGSPDVARAGRTVVQRALRQANLVPKYMQIIEIRDGSSPGKEQALECIQSTRPKKPISLRFNGISGWLGVCSMVWQLRGWVHDQPVSQAKNWLLYTSGPDGAASVVILCRSDGRVAPSWKDVKDVREGRERLGYNAAVETRDISREDLENVRAPRDFTVDEAVKKLELPVKGGDRAALARL